MKKTGFTLIELLAVIVILAIIALIAVPIILNIINDAKKSSDEEAVKLYTSTVEKAIIKQQLSNPNFNPNQCIIQSEGSLNCNKGTEQYKNIKIEMKGNMPSSGVVIIEENKIKFINIIFNGKKYYELTNLVEDNGNAGLSIGDKYTYKVNDTDTFNFYVLSFNEEDNTVNLIMDRNICNDGTTPTSNKLCTYAWHEIINDNNYGPDTAMINLYNGTKGWINVPDMIMNYEDEYNKDDDTLGYKTIKTDINTKVTTITGKQNKTSENQVFGNRTEPLKSRLPKNSEVRSKEAGCHRSENYSVENYGTCVAWLINGLEQNSTYYPDNDHVDELKGYWIMASQPNFCDSHYVSAFGFVNDYGTTATNKFGVRAVITVPRSYLE